MVPNRGLFCSPGNTWQCLEASGNRALLACSSSRPEMLLSTLPGTGGPIMENSPGEMSTVLPPRNSEAALTQNVRGDLKGAEGVAQPRSWWAGVCGGHFR